jgi:hypothetical protein
VRHFVLDSLCNTKYITATLTFENIEYRQAEAKDNAKTFVTQSISQPHQPLKNYERAHGQRQHNGRSTKHDSGRRGSRVRIAVWASPLPQEA